MESTVTGHQGSDKRSSRAKENRGRIRRIFRGPDLGGERDFEPDEQSSWVIEQTRAEVHRAVNYLAAQKRVAASPTDLDGSRPAYLLRHVAMLALDGEIDPSLTFRGAVERLQSAWDLLNERADEQETIERRTAAASAVALKVARKFAEAVHVEEMVERATGEKLELELDTEAIGTGLAELQINAHRPLDATMQFPEPLYTPGMPDPRKAVAEVEVTQVLPSPLQFPPFGQDNGHAHPDVAEPESPVHEDDGTTPPLPVDDQSAAEPTPLPKRVKPVHWISAADHPDVLGKSVDPAKTEIAAGDWVRDEGSDCSGGPAWGVVAEVKLGKEFTRITFASGLPVKVYAGRTVRMLTSAEAKSLLAEAEAQSGSAA